MKTHRFYLARQKTLTVRLLGDILNLAMLTGYVGLGIYIGSTLMQIMGVGLWIVTILATASTAVGKGPYYTIDQARTRLDEIEREGR